MSISARVVALNFGKKIGEGAVRATSRSTPMSSRPSWERSGMTKLLEVNDLRQEQIKFTRKEAINLQVGN